MLMYDKKGSDIFFLRHENAKIFLNARNNELFEDSTDKVQ